MFLCLLKRIGKHSNKNALAYGGLVVVVVVIETYASDGTIDVTVSLLLRSYFFSL